MLSNLLSTKRTPSKDHRLSVDSCQKEPNRVLSLLKRRSTVTPIRHTSVSPVKIEDQCDSSHGELLPSYTCSVMKSGIMNIKREMDDHEKLSVDRRWKRHYVQLHGTLLDVFSRSYSKKKHDILQFGLQGAEVGWARDYDQRPYTIRLRSTLTGEQILMRPFYPLKKRRYEKEEEYRMIQMIEWIEQVQAAINISMDIDHQRMPTFVTLARTHYRHHPNMATVVLGQSKLVIQTCPCRRHGYNATTTTTNTKRSGVSFLKRVVHKSLY